MPATIRRGAICAEDGGAVPAGASVVGSVEARGGVRRAGAAGAAGGRGACPAADRAGAPVLTPATAFGFPATRRRRRLTARDRTLTAMASSPQPVGGWLHTP